MKKIYSAPKTTIVAIEPVLMNTTSPGYTETVTNETSGNLSRGDFDWDDDDY